MANPPSWDDIQAWKEGKGKTTEQLARELQEGKVVDRKTGKVTYIGGVSESIPSGRPVSPAQPTTEEKPVEMKPVEVKKPPKKYVGWEETPKPVVSPVEIAAWKAGGVPTKLITDIASGKEPSFKEGREEYYKKTAPDYGKPFELEGEKGKPTVAEWKSGGIGTGDFLKSLKEEKQLSLKEAKDVGLISSVEYEKQQKDIGKILTPSKTFERGLISEEELRAAPEGSMYELGEPTYPMERARLLGALELRGKYGQGLQEILGPGMVPIERFTLKESIVQAVGGSVAYKDFLKTVEIEKKLGLTEAEKQSLQAPSALQPYEEAAKGLVPKVRSDVNPFIQAPGYIGGKVAYWGATAFTDIGKTLEQWTKPAQWKASYGFFTQLSPGEKQYLWKGTGTEIYKTIAADPAEFAGKAATSILVTYGVSKGISALGSKAVASFKLWRAGKPSFTLGKSTVLVYKTETQGSLMKAVAASQSEGITKLGSVAVRSTATGRFDVIIGSTKSLAGGKAIIASEAFGKTTTGIKSLGTQYSVAGIKTIGVQAKGPFGTPVLFSGYGKLGVITKKGLDTSYFATVGKATPVAEIAKGSLTKTFLESKPLTKTFVPGTFGTKVGLGAELSKVTVKSFGFQQAATPTGSGFNVLFTKSQAATSAGASAAESATKALEVAGSKLAKTTYFKQAAPSLQIPAPNIDGLNIDFKKDYEIRQQTYKVSTTQRAERIQEVSQKQDTASLTAQTQRPKIIQIPTTGLVQAIEPIQSQRQFLTPITAPAIDTGRFQEQKQKATVSQRLKLTQRVLTPTVFKTTGKFKFPVIAPPKFDSSFFGGKSSRLLFGKRKKKKKQVGVPSAFLVPRRAGLPDIVASGIGIKGPIAAFGAYRKKRGRLLI